MHLLPQNIIPTKVLLVLPTVVLSLTQWLIYVFLNPPIKPSIVALDDNQDDFTWRQNGLNS